jgi:16S rRNA (cytosine967-C5)-methyltransferase
MNSSRPRLARRPHTARSLALQVLLDCHSGEAFVQEILDNQLTRAGLSTADRRLATQLAYGVLRRRGTLDALLRPLLRRQPHQVEPWLWEALRLGAFQLALLTQIPVHAALYETVELAAAYQRPQAKGFLNGMLRNLAALLTPEHASSPAPDALPLERDQYRRLVRPVLPDPATDRVQYLAAGFSVPRWLAIRWLERFPWEECLRLGFWFAGPAPLWLRCNTLRTDRATLRQALFQAGIRTEEGVHSQALRLTDHAAIRELPGYEEGWFAVQDESAMRVASALAPQPRSRVLDLCAAPGSKTTHLAELMRNQGQVVACDVDDRRLRTLADLCQRLGVTIVEPCRLHPERNEEPPAGPFDAILVDVPCSNTGVLGRRPDVRWRLRPADFRHLVCLQTKLLFQAAERIRPAGAIVYSTCSIEPEENRPVVQAVLQAMPDLVLEAEEEQVPGRPADGGYWARLWRKTL